MPCQENALSRVASLDALKESEGSRALTAQLVAFRQRFPVDDRAFEFLESSTPAVVATVLRDFRVKQEGEADYSGLLTSFVRQVQGTFRPWGVNGFPEAKESRNSATPGAISAREKRTPKRPRSESRESSYSEYYSSVSPSSEENADPSHRDSSQNSDDDCSSAKSSVSKRSARSSPSKRHGVEVESAEKLLQSAIYQASRDEQRKIKDAEAEEKRRVDVEVARVRTEAEEQMRNRIAEFEEMVRKEMDVRIEKASKAAVAASFARMQAVEEEAEAERESKVKAARSDLQEAKRQLREAKEASQRRRDKQQQQQYQFLQPKAKHSRKVTLTKTKLAKVTLKKRKLDQGEKKPRSRDRPRRRERSRSKNARQRSRDGPRRSRRDRRESSRLRSRSPYASDGHRHGHPGLVETARGPEASKMKAFRERYPMDDSAWDTLADAPPDVQWAVVAQFKPRREGEDDYSALIASFVRSILVRRAAPFHLEGRPEDGLYRIADRKHASMLAAFRSRYPMDERAYATLERSPISIQTTVMNCFQPRREGEDDYSALVMSFVRSVLARQGGDFNA